MPVNRQTVEHLVALVHSQPQFADWVSFSHPQFLKDEVDYKRKAAAKATELLSAAELQRLIDSGDYTAVIERLEKVGRATNLLFQSTPSTGDLNLLYQANLDKREFALAMLDLLHGGEPVDVRFERYLTFVQANGLPNRWTFATYFLFLCHPDTEIFVKPATTRRFLALVGQDDAWTAKPTTSAYSRIRQLAHDLKAALQDYQPHDLIDIQGLIWVAVRASKTSDGPVSATRQAEFARLFKEFATSYPATQAGQQHVAAYDAVRDQARTNYAVIVAAADRGEDVTDQVLLKFLPYSNTQSNHERGAWTHMAPAVAKDIKTKFQGAGWTKPEDWPEVAQAILTFVRRCVEQPADLSKACEEFSASPVSRGFQTGMLTPILNALRPDDFMLINNKSRALVNHFTHSKFAQKLTDYPATNTALQQLLEELADDMTAPGVPDLRPADLFDMFGHWLVAIKKYFKDIGDEPESAGELAEPFSLIFADRAEAEWALDLMADTAQRLGVTDAGNPRIAVTMRRVKRQHHLHLDYGNWLILCFAGQNGQLASLQLALLDEPLAVTPIAVAQFAQPAGEPALWLKTFNIEDVRAFDGEIREAFNRTLAYTARRFSNWSKSPFSKYSLPQVVAAILDPAQRDVALLEGSAVVPVTGQEEDEAGLIQYWKIAPGENAWQWPDCQQNGFVGIGWEDLGDLSGLSREQFEERRAAAFERHDGWTKDAVEQVWRFAQIKVGDRIVANRGTTEVLGIGTVTGPYFYRPGERYGHRLPVRWDDVSPRQVSEGGWRKTLIELERTKFEAILAQPVEVVPVAVSAPPVLQPNYPLEQCAEDTHLDPTLLAQWVRAIERKRQAVLYGPPGTGKTYLAEHLARHLIGGGDGFSELVQFHPAYAYEDFIQGIRPQRVNGGLDYPIVPGRFLEFCRRAADCTGLCVLIIDEINRANLARVFGELMYLLEYRDREVPLAGGGRLQVPDNVRLIGTMNTADRSIALVDHALRRRFAFIALRPDLDALRRYHVATGFDATALINLLDRLNQQIGDPHYTLGISYFLHPQLAEHLADIWRMEIEPYLEEYFFDQPGKVDEFRWAKIASSVMP